MKRESRIALASLAVVGTLGLTAAAVQDAAPQEAGYDPAMMENLMKYGAPGEEHAAFEKLVGDWELTVRMRMTPEAPWQESKARCSRELVMGGRFLKESVTGDWEGQPFEGFALVGYDKLREEYQYLWVDNFGTGMMIGQGPAKGSGFMVEGDVSNPMQADPHSWFRAVWSMDDGPIYSMYAKGPDGTEFQNLEIIGQRL